MKEHRPWLKIIQDGLNRPKLLERERYEIEYQKITSRLDNMRKEVLTLEARANDIRNKLDWTGD